MHPENPKATVLQIDNYNHNSSIWYGIVHIYNMYYISQYFLGVFNIFSPRDPADLNFVKWFLFKKAAEANSLYT